MFLLCRNALFMQKCNPISEWIVKSSAGSECKNFINRVKSIECGVIRPGIEVGRILRHAPLIIQTTPSWVTQ